MASGEAFQLVLPIKQESKPENGAVVTAYSFSDGSVVKNLGDQGSEGVITSVELNGEGKISTPAQTRKRLGGISSTEVFLREGRQKVSTIL